MLFSGDDAYFTAGSTARYIFAGLARNRRCSGNERFALLDGCVGCFVDLNFLRIP